MFRARHTVKGQGSSFMAQIQPHSGRTWVGNFDFHFIVPKCTSRICKGNTPGLVIVSKAAFFYVWPFVAHRHLNSGPLPLNFPVANTRQTFGAQHLIIFGKSLCVVGILLGFLGPSNFGVFLREQQVLKSCVGIQTQATGILNVQKLKDKTNI